MKKTLSIVILLIVIRLCNSQTQQIIIYTPNGTPLNAVITTEWPSYAIEYSNHYHDSVYHEAKRLADASALYNCHSYAWNMVEGGPKCWLGEDQEVSKYWEDGSYVETTKAFAEKIVYFWFTKFGIGLDHSAITSVTNPGQQVSKWGPAPLYRHPSDHHPYYLFYTGNQQEQDTSIVKYYRRPCINGFIQADTVNLGNKAVIYSGSVDILPGNTYIVTDTVRFACDASITVQPGGKLIVDGGVLTNACIDGMWKGIVVKGSTTTPQNSQTQGSVILTNATIENAEIAINIAPTDNPTNGNGGIIQATNSKFINNVQSINYGSYENKNSSGSIINNMGTFIKCIFSINQNNFFTANNKTFQWHVKLNQVRGIEFSGCSFNNISKLTTPYIGTGILAQDAGFKVTTYCSAISINCGCSDNAIINSVFEYLLSPIDVSNSGLNYSVYIDQCKLQNVTVGANIKSTPYFQFTRSNVTNFTNFGLLSASSSGYKIEQNIFNGFGTGIGINNSGAASNLVYRNTFSSNTQGVSVFGINNSPYILTGLQIKCNQFKKCGRDILLQSSATIATNQGSSTEGADNCFTGTSYSSLQIVTPFGLVYFRNSTPCYNPFNPIGVTRISNATANLCQATLCSNIVRDNEGIETYSGLQNERDILLREYELGNYGYIFENMENEEFPEELIEEALLLSGNIHKLNEEMRELSDNSIRSIIHDSIMDINLLKSWYEIVHTPIAKYLLAETRLFTDDYEGADAILYEIPDMFNFGEPEMEEHSNYIRFHNFKKQLQLENRSWSEIEDREISYLQTIAEANTGRSSTMAKGVLCFFFNICYEENFEDFIETLNKNSETINFEPETLNPKPVSEYGLTIYPNPAQTEITVSIGSSKVSIDKVELYDIFGKLLIKQNFYKSNGTIPINKVPDGIYVIKIYLSNGDVENMKVVKQQNGK